MLSDNIVDYFLQKKREPLAAWFFLKAIFFLALIKLISIWIVADVVFAEYSKQTPESWYSRIIMLGSELAASNIDLFLALFAAFLVFALIVRPDYRINLAFFWFELNYLRVLHPLANGSDFVMLALALFAIPLVPRQGHTSAYLQIISNGVFNCFRILIQIQVLSIYLVSGWDKLISEVWRSGNAFEYISNLELVFNPVFAPLFQSATMQLVMSWITIGFELLFIPLVLIERTRLPILAIGAVFHLVIWLMLGLPGFGWVMIISYTIFLRDRDFNRLPRRIRPSLP